MVLFRPGALLTLVVTLGACSGTDKAATVPNYGPVYAALLRVPAEARQISFQTLGTLTLDQNGSALVGALKLIDSRTNAVVVEGVPALAEGTSPSATAQSDAPSGGVTIIASNEPSIHADKGLALVSTGIRCASGQILDFSAAPSAYIPVPDSFLDAYNEAAAPFIIPGGAGSTLAEDQENTEGVPTVTIARGVPPYHVANYEAAKLGTVMPTDPNANLRPDQHINAGRRIAGSQLSSWSLDPRVAHNYAEGGIVLKVKVPISSVSTTDASLLDPHQEVVVAGPIHGATVIPVNCYN